MTNNRGASHLPSPESSDEYTVCATRPSTRCQRIRAAIGCRPARCRLARYCHFVRTRRHAGCRISQVEWRGSEGDRACRARTRAAPRVGLKCTAAQPCQACGRLCLRPIHTCHRHCLPNRQIVESGPAGRVQRVKPPLFHIVIHRLCGYPKKGLFIHGLAIAPQVMPDVMRGRDGGALRFSACGLLLCKCTVVLSVPAEP